MTDRVVYLIYPRALTELEKTRLLQLQNIVRVFEAGNDTVVMLDKPIRMDDVKPTTDIAQMITNERAGLGVVHFWSDLTIPPIKTKLMVHEWLPVRRDDESIDDFVTRLRVFMRIEDLVWEAEGKAA